MSIIKYRIFPAKPALSSLFYLCVLNLRALFIALFGSPLRISSIFAQSSILKKFLKSLKSNALQSFLVYIISIS